MQSTDVALIREQGSSIAKLRKSNPAELLTMLTKAIINTYQIVQVKRKFPESFCDRIAERIMDKYWYLKMEEIHVILENGMFGEYGTFYESFGPNTIFEWIESYEKSEEVQSYINKKNTQHKSEESSGRNISILEAPQFREKLKALMEAPTENEILNIAKPVPTKDTVKESIEPKTIEGYQTVDVQKYSNELTKIIKAGGQLTKEQSQWIKDMNGTVVAGLGIQYKL